MVPYRYIDGRKNIAVCRDGWGNTQFIYFQNGYFAPSDENIDNGFIIPDGYYLSDTVARETIYVRSERQNGPNDYPPGPGYSVMRATGAYIPHTKHRIASGKYEGMTGLFSQPSLPPPQGLWTYPYVVKPPLSYDWVWTSQGSPYVLAREKAVKNLYGSLARRRRLELGVMLGELRETLNLLGSTVIDLVQIYSALKKGKVNKAIEIVRRRGRTSLPTKYPDRRDVNRRRRNEGKPPLTPSEYAANAWLELQFGWLPVIEDVYKIISYVQELLMDKKKSPYFSFSGYSSTSVVNQVTYSVTKPSTFKPGIQAIMDSELHLKCSITATFKLSSSAIDVLTSLGLDNPAVIFWNLMPLSFVVDWILPVGNWLESFTAYAGLDLIEVTPSYKVKVTRKLNRYKITAAPVGFDPSWIVFDGADGKQPFEVFEEFQRFPRTLTSLPPFPQRFTFEEILSPWKLITSAALIKQLAK